MDFLADFWKYYSCYEIPRNYALWSGLGVLGATVHRKMLYCHGDIEIHPTLYIGLIGPQGSSKSTSCGFAKGFYTEACPDIPIGPSRASPESIVKTMTDEKFARSFTNWDQELTEVRPYIFFINEFKNFVGRSPFDMITFLTDIYDVKVYDASTIIRGAEKIINPAVNILMCETPEWFIKNIKGDIISGGIARRFVLVYEMDDTEPRPFIVIPSDVVEAKKRVIQRLIDVRKLTGEFKWGDGRSAYETWYMDNHKRRIHENNGMMRGYLKSKNAQLYKVMMCLDACNDKPMFLFTKDLVDLALALLGGIERNMPKLSLAAGRNEMAASYHKALDLLEQNGGAVPEKQLRRELETELSPTEIYSAMRHLEETEQIVKKTMRIPNSKGEPVERCMILLPSRFAKGLKDGEFSVAKKT